jgi:hypothetical protein
MVYQGYRAPAEVAKAQRSSSISTTNESADVYLKRHSAPALCNPWLELSYKMIRGASAHVVPRSSHDCFTELIGSIKLSLTADAILHRRDPRPGPRSGLAYGRHGLWTGHHWLGQVLAKVSVPNLREETFLLLVTSDALAIYPYAVSAVSLLLSTQLGSDCFLACLASEQLLGDQVE